MIVVLSMHARCPGSQSKKTQRINQRTFVSISRQMDSQDKK